MEFLNPGFLAGAALALIPILLHLILREKPRRELFPALRLLRYRHQIVIRRLRVRHLLLLALRVLLLLLLAFALARPRVRSSLGAFDERAPAAAAFIIDTSMSMEYREQDATAFERALQAARELLADFPESSEILVLDGSQPSSALFWSPADALRRLEQVRLRSRASDLSTLVLEAIQQLSESSLERKEIYLFTDLMQGCLDLSAAEKIQKALAQFPMGVTACIYDVGTDEPRNVSIDRAGPLQETIPAYSNLTVHAELSAMGQDLKGRLELYLDGQLRGQQPVEVRRGEALRLEFPLRGLGPGSYEGEIRLYGPKAGLQFDDHWYFAVDVRSPTRVGVVSFSREEALALLEALAPKELVRLGRARHQWRWFSPAEFRDVRVEDFDVIYLLDVPTLSSDQWRLLQEFVGSGGGLGVFLGPRCEPAGYASEDAQALLPARLQQRVAPPDTTRMELVTAQHPAFRALHAWDPDALGRVVVYEYWRLQVDPQTARTLIKYRTGEPAVLEKIVPEASEPGRRAPGPVVLFSTPVHVAPALKRWNDLPQSAATFVIMMDSLTLYLSGLASLRWNWVAGEDLAVNLGRDAAPGPFQLVGPQRSVLQQGSLEPGQRIVVVASQVAEQPGYYKILWGPEEKRRQASLAVNVSRSESRLDRLSQGAVTALFPEGTAMIARTSEELRTATGKTRVGQELYPYLIPLLLIVFLAEHYLANRFYERPKESPAGRRSLTVA
jgi:hypothetical protein